MFGFVDDFGSFFVRCGFTDGKGRCIKEAGHWHIDGHLIATKEEEILIKHQEKNQIIIGLIILFIFLISFTLHP